MSAKTHPTKNTTPYTLRLRPYIRYLKSKADVLITLFIFIIALYAYTSTLAPTVIEGDAALFQYTPYVLGVTYPTGFPFYILLGKVWVTIFPVGEIAWRMNLLSALCSCVALALIYNAARHFFAPQLAGARWAALATVLMFGSLPTFWRWSTEAKTYALNILLFSGILYATAKAIKNTPQTRSTAAARTLMSPLQSFRLSISGWSDHYPMALPFVLLGFFISVHNTGVLLIPGLVVMTWLNFRPHRRLFKKWLLYLLGVILPGLFYFYIPLRAEWLIATYGRRAVIEHGLLADFYYSGWYGFVGYFAGVGFTKGVVTNWSLLPLQFFTVYMPLLIEDMTRLGVVLGLIGGLGLALIQARIFIPFFLMYVLPIPLVIVYGQGEQSAFLLPSFLMVCFFGGYIVIFIVELLIKFLTYYLPQTEQDISYNALYVLRFSPPLLLLILIPALIWPQIQHNSTWLSVKWNRNIYNEWATVLNHPLEPEAGILSPWGDLTSFWYMQHAEGYRPDLRGTYPLTQTTISDWYEHGNENLYLYLPQNKVISEDWATGISDHYQFVPWGRLVRIAPQETDSERLLPNLPQRIETSFGDKLHLIAVDYPSEAVAGQDYPITLSWQAMAELRPETIISLRLVQNGITVAQLDERLYSAWFPQETLPPGQAVLSYTLLPVPLGTLPGEYRLQLVAYRDLKQPWALPDASIVLDLGAVELVPWPVEQEPDTRDYKLLSAHDFNHELKLVGYSYSVRRVGQGKGFALRLLWQAIKQAEDNYTLLVEQFDANGNLLRGVEHQPLNGLAPTASWQPGHYIRDQVNLVVPASAPPGEDMLYMRVSWLRSDGSKLNLRRWAISLDDGLNLGQLAVTEKKKRVFDLPPMQYPVGANLENKVRLMGYNSAQGNTQAEFGQIQQSHCVVNNEDCRLEVEFYWQGISEMDKPYQAFLHLVDEQGQIVAQHDRTPGADGRQPTTAWLPGEVVTDPIQLPLPSDIPAGRYTIRLGMYLPPTGPRLVLVDEANQPPVNYLDVGMMEVMSE